MNTKDTQHLTEVVAFGDLVLQQAQSLGLPQGLDAEFSLLGLAAMAVDHGKTILWAHHTKNRSALMISMRSLLELLFNVDSITRDTGSKEYMALLFLSEDAERSLSIFKSKHAPIPKADPDVQALIKLIKSMRSEMKKKLRGLPKPLNAPERWKDVSVGQRALDAGMRDFYDFIYNIGSGYTHADGSAVVDRITGQESGWASSAGMAAGFILEVIDKLLRQNEPLNTLPTIVQTWEHVVRDYERA